VLDGILFTYTFVDTVSEDSAAPNFWEETGSSSDHGKPPTKLHGITYHETVYLTLLREPKI
jgi:hypothetical protein